MNVPSNLQDIVAEANSAANRACLAFLGKYYEGVDRGPCGFAWVFIYDDENKKIRKNSRLGKALASLGITQGGEGVHNVINPGPSHLVQNVDALLAGAKAYAEVFSRHGFNAFARSRLD